MSMFDIGNRFSDAKSSKVCIVKVPYEHTVSYFPGCSLGPAAIYRASRYVELFDEELKVQPHKVGICEKNVMIESDDHEMNLLSIGQNYLDSYNSGKFPIALGGEHSITIGIVSALYQQLGSDFTVIQFDAHSDLRDTYKGNPLSHACVMRRIAEMGLSTIALGIRSMSSSEYTYASHKKLPIIYGASMHKMDSSEILDFVLRQSKPKVYITFDVDYFSTSIMPFTGTPEPGGLEWYKTLEILKGIFMHCNVLGCDIVELVGNESDNIGCFNAALLTRKLIGYKFF